MKIPAQIADHVAMQKEDLTIPQSGLRSFLVSKISGNFVTAAPWRIPIQHDGKVVVVPRFVPIQRAITGALAIGVTRPLAGLPVQIFRRCSFLTTAFYPPKR